MEQCLVEVERWWDEVEKHMNEAIENYSLAEELCSDAEERERKPVANLVTFRQ